MTTVESPSSGSSSPPVRHRFPRRALIGAAAALAICAMLVIGLVRAGRRSGQPVHPDRPRLGIRGARPAAQVQFFSEGVRAAFRSLR